MAPTLKCGVNGCGHTVQGEMKADGTYSFDKMVYHHDDVHKPKPSSSSTAPQSGIDAFLSNSRHSDGSVKTATSSPIVPNRGGSERAIYPK